MQTAVVYGRLFVSQAREAIAPLFRKEAPARFRLIAACCGFSKDISRTHQKFSFGEDAYFMTENRYANVLGVADGVGGWRQYGIDSSVFSSSLMKSCETFVLQGGLEPPPPPIAIVKAGYEDITEQKAPCFGSSTACIVVLDKKSKVLHSTNLGDSGFVVIRRGEVVHQSSEQQHYFNTPYQLAIPPPGQEGNVIQDSMEEAESSSFSMEEGDLIVMGTDGLFDNMSMEHILDEVEKLEDNSEESVRAVADSIASQACELANSACYISPFAKQAQAQGIPFVGGKPDDITVLIALVSLEAKDGDS